MSSPTYFIDAILPLPIPNTFSYRVPKELEKEIEIGKRVVVPFSKSGLHTAVIYAIHQSPPAGYEARYIEAVIDEHPVLNKLHLDFWKWMSDYYLCTIGEVMNAALPSGLKLSSETRVILNNSESLNKELLNDDEYLIVEALESVNILSIDEVQKIIQSGKTRPVIKSLLSKKAIVIEEELQYKYKPVYETWISLNPEIANDDALNNVMHQLEKKAFKQLELLMTFLKEGYNNDLKTFAIPKKILLKNFNHAEQAYTSLVRKKIFTEKETEKSRLKEFSASEPINTLNELQLIALHEIKNHFKNKETVLLHGVTSSGKTEVYIKLIEETIQQGKQALYLLPEIALTEQIIQRLQKKFGSDVGVYHSRFNENERVEIWNKVITDQNKYSVIVGARSALFLPFTRLGLIIVDEEHDTSFKQFDPAPRYHCRDSAIMLGQLTGAKVILGTATPSIESYHNAKEGKYGLVKMSKRFNNVLMPEIILSDIGKEKKANAMRSHFSLQLMNEIHAAMKNNEQVILFQNRRGFSNTLQCNICSWTPRCKYCDVSLVYHKNAHRLKCHYCGYTESVPVKCKACESHELRTIGFGTEKIEEELQNLIPNAKIKRMDLDTTRTKNAHRQIINEFENGDIDVLIGTQMVTKGFDFSNVSLVGILNADSLLSFPDFRSHERGYQLIEQVAGRAGRVAKRGKVIVQTYNVQHPVLRFVIDHRYEDLFNSEMLQRRNFNYPPFARLIELTVQHKRQEITEEAAYLLHLDLKKHLQSNVIGPSQPIVSKIKNMYLKNILIKITSPSALIQTKKSISESIIRLKSEKSYATVKVVADVDPY